MCCTRLAESTACKNSPSAHHRTNLSGYVFATKHCIDNRKNLLNGNMSISTCPHNMVNFGTVTAEIGWRFWGTPTNFNAFRVLASLLRRRRTTEVNHRDFRDLINSIQQRAPPLFGWAAITLVIAHILVYLLYPFLECSFYLYHVNLGSWYWWWWLTRSCDAACDSFFRHAASVSQVIG